MRGVRAKLPEAAGARKGDAGYRRREAKALTGEVRVLRLAKENGMIDYIYDGSFDGLLTVIWHHYYTDRAAGIFTEDRYQPSFLQGCREVATEAEKADRVYKAIRSKISEYDLRSVYRAWLSCDPQKEMKILRYLVLGFRQGHRTSSLHGEPAVADFQAILKKIGHESERMLQFVRFSVIPAGAGRRVAEPGGSAKPVVTPAEAGQRDAREILYARVEPDNDVIELVAKHFCDRFRSEPFIIHDVGRDKAVIGYEGRWAVTAFALAEVPEVTEDEKSFRQLWKQYFDHIAILQRTNSRCQNNFIPDRYRKHLTEIVTPPHAKTV